MLVEVSIPLEVIGMVRCDFDGYYHVEVLGEEVDTDEDTYRRVIKAREAHRLPHVEVALKGMGFMDGL